MVKKSIRISEENYNKLMFFKKKWQKEQDEIDGARWSMDLVIYTLLCDETENGRLNEEIDKLKAEIKQLENNPD